MNKGTDLKEKKLRGSGGHVYAKVTEEEQKRGNLGGPDLFIAGVGRLDDSRFSRYYCSKCEKEYKGSPMINYENPNEQLGEGVTLIEKGEYRCKTCNSILAQYRKFDAPIAAPTSSEASTVSNNGALTSRTPSVQSKNAHLTPNSITKTAPNEDEAPIPKATSLTSQPGFVPIQSLVGMPAYDSEAVLVGTVKEIGLHRSPEGQVQISLKISKDILSSTNEGSSHEVTWDDVSKIGDVVLLATTTKKMRITNGNQHSTKRKCTSCGYQNEEDAIFCEECGNKLI
jgi:sporulation protein YlmC with PRC-barrel domain/DNA-directed RNA polymerase subunit RPC12/RpoP